MVLPNRIISFIVLLPSRTTASIFYQGQKSYLRGQRYLVLDYLLTYQKVLIIFFLNDKYIHPLHTLIPSSRQQDSRLLGTYNPSGLCSLRGRNGKGIGNTITKHANRNTPVIHNITTHTHTHIHTYAHTHTYAYTHIHEHLEQITFGIFLDRAAKRDRSCLGTAVLNRRKWEGKCKWEATQVADKLNHWPELIGLSAYTSTYSLLFL
ncbi:hypothetical protein F5Y11DRAFT_153786 [Daldinia sp. FL1419]|nr:hypothetical protein F5Y11DRAFT_153786 [Daldinia sp. FL1419]